MRKPSRVSTKRKIREAKSERHPQTSVAETIDPENISLEDAEDAPDTIIADIPDGGFNETGPLATLDAVEAEVVPDQIESTETESTETGLVPTDPLQRYLAEIRHIPLLTREEEHELAVSYFKQGDQRAAYKLVLANLRLVVMIAREYQRNVQNVLDLVQEGNIGLLEAVKQYDPFRGIRFPSYAVYWIRAYMLRYLINNLRLVKVGTTQAQRKLVFNLQKEKDRLEAEGFVPEAKLLAERLNVKESEVLEMEQRLALPDLSVDATVRGTDDSVDLHGILPDTAENAEQVVVREQFSDALRQAVEKFKTELDDKEKAIIDRRLFTEDPATLQQVADDFGLSRERIRQIEARLKDRLKVFLRESLDLGEEGEVDIGID